MSTILACVVLFGVILTGIRLCVCLPFINRVGAFQTSLQARHDKHIMFLLGSGGHTGEMIRLVKSIDLSKFSRISWVITEGDLNSLKKGSDLSAKLNQKIDFITLPRARNVGQLFSSSVPTTLKCFLKTFTLMARDYPLPDVILCNGPGTSVPLCYMCVLLSILVFKKVSVVYVESLARVNRLSLSGNLLYPISSKFIVQWKSLQGGRREYHGILV